MTPCDPGLARSTGGGQDGVMHRLLALALVPALFLGAADPLGAAEGPSVKDVHAAIARGADWLKGAHANGFKTRTWHEPVELVVLTLSHAGVPANDPVMATGIETARAHYLQVAYMLSHLEQFGPAHSAAMLCHASISKNYATEMAISVTNKAMELMGSYGYIRDYHVEKY